MPTKHLSSLLALSVVLISMHGLANAGIIGLLTQSTAEGFVGLGGSEQGEGDNIYISNPQINASFGNQNFGSASRFDSISDLDGDKILFMNANSSYGFNSFSTSKTVVDISYQNTSNEVVRPKLQSQILAAGMGFYLSDCTAENLLTCGSSDDPSYGFGDITGPLADGGVVSSQFSFRVQAGDEVLFSLSGSVFLNIDSGPNTIVQDFDEATGFLNNFRQTSPLGSTNQLTFDWDSTDFEVLFPVDLILEPGEIGTISYITEITTGVVAQCSGGLLCPIAYAAFGDPIGRGGLPSSRPQIEGIEPGLYELKASFDNDIIRLFTTSRPNLPIASVPSPAPLTLLMLGSAFLMIRRLQQPK